MLCIRYKFIFIRFNNYFIFLGSFDCFQNSTDNMKPSQLSHYTRKCYRDGCNGIITVTKHIGQHIFIKINMNTSTKIEELKCKVQNLPDTILIESQR